MRIYVIFGSTGEWSDRHEWTVDAHKTEQDAQEIVVELEEKARIAKLRTDLDYDDPNHLNTWDDEAMALAVAGDPLFQMTYTGTRYYYETVWLYE